MKRLLVLFVSSLSLGASACKDLPPGPITQSDAGATSAMDGGRGPVEFRGPVDFIAGPKEGEVGRLEADDSCSILHRKAGGPLMFGGGGPDEITLRRERYQKDSAECMLMRAAADSLQTINARLGQCQKDKENLYKQCVEEIEKVKKGAGK